MQRENFLVVDAVNTMYYNGMIDWVFNNSNLLVFAGGENTEQSIADLESLIAQVFVPRRSLLNGAVYFYRNVNDYGEITIDRNHGAVARSICS